MQYIHKDSGGQIVDHNLPVDPMMGTISMLAVHAVL